MKCFLCRLGFHDYGPWGKPLQFGFASFLNRSCVRCGWTQQKEVGWAGKPTETKGSEVLR